MKRLIILFIFVIISGFITTSCIFDDDFNSDHVVDIRNTISSKYIHDDINSKWYCRDAVVITDNKQHLIEFPYLYDGIIVVGTKVKWHCHDMKSYYDGKHWIDIDWINTQIIDN